MPASGGPIRSLWDLGFIPGGVTAGLLTPPLVGLIYLLDQLAGLPFAPFAFFDWIARVLPGPVVTFGIDLMIDGLRLVGMSVAAAAKTSEQVIAILMFLSLGVVVSAIFFAVMKTIRISPKPFSGLVLGAVFGLPMAVAGLSMGQNSPFALWETYFPS
jgi:hypothetical protein